MVYSNHGNLCECLIRFLSIVDSRNDEYGQFLQARWTFSFYEVQVSQKKKMVEYVDNDTRRR